MCVCVFSLLFKVVVLCRMVNHITANFESDGHAAFLVGGYLHISGRSSSFWRPGNASAWRGNRVPVTCVCFVTRPLSPVKPRGSGNRSNGRASTSVFSIGLSPLVVFTRVTMRFEIELQGGNSTRRYSRHLVHFSEELVIRDSCTNARCDWTFPPM